MKKGPIRMLEFGCGAGMNLLHLIAALGRDGIQIASGVGTDFSPVLIEAARREAKNHLREEDRRKATFCVAKNETLSVDLAKGLGKAGVGTKELVSLRPRGEHYAITVTDGNRQLDCAAMFSPSRARRRLRRHRHERSVPGLPERGGTRWRDKGDQGECLPSVSDGIRGAVRKTGFELLRVNISAGFPIRPGGFSPVFCARFRRF